MPQALQNGATPTVAIIGAGVAGLCMAIQLKLAGLNDFTIYEKAGELGGTWRDNTYPGAGCDVPSMFYSFSFEPKTDWSRKFAEQPEILGYLRFCADKYELAPHFRFNSEVAEARFDTEAGLWRLRMTNGDTHAANFLVAGCGQLNRPWIPSIPGKDEFQGVAFHSARWNHEVDLAGKHVAVIGNGASAIQFVPCIAPVVGEMQIFQRSANYVVPKPDRPFKDWERAMFTRFPIVTRLYRAWIWSQLEMRWPAFSKGRGWVSRQFTKAAQKELETQLADPELRATQTPDYPVGCKRILITNDYYNAIARDNVHVVTEPIARITPNGVQTTNGRDVPADVIIYATGFDTTHFLAPIQIGGAHNEALADVWKNGAEAYLGIAVSGFPNMFLLYGPNTNLGHNSIIFMIECQVRYAMQCIHQFRRRQLKYLDVRPDAMGAFNAEIQRKLGETVWATGCSSWYKNEFGKITNNWAYSTTQYWWRTRKPDFAHFVLAKDGDKAATAESTETAVGAM